MKSSNIIFLVILVVVFYALMVLPQRRQQKQRKNMMQSLAPGAKVLTAGGIYAQITEVHDDLYVARIAPETEVELDVRAILRVVEPAPKPETSMNDTAL